MKSKKLWIPIILSLVLLFSLLAVAYLDSNTAAFRSTKNTITCRVTLENKILTAWNILDNFDVEIDGDPECVKGDVCGTLETLSLADLISDKGTLRLKMKDGASRTTDYTIREWSSETFELEVCSSVDVGDIDVFDKNGDIIDTAKVIV
jgi:hypothetical protein